MPSTIQSIRTLTNAVRDTVITWRRQLHMDPEPSFHEVRTAQFVAETLASFEGLEIQRPTPTSVVARLRGRSSGPVLAMRADLDALLIEERNTHNFVSRNPGVMHACGHDGHTAMLLGAANVLCQLRGALCGEVRFIFQHAEELYPGGARELVRAGVLDDVDLIAGAHLWLSLPVGKVSVKAGALMAAPDTFEIVVIGRGGHAAAPEQTVDPIVVAAQIVTNLQHIVARNVDPLGHAVVSVTEIVGGTALNVIPGSVQLRGTVRTFEEDVRVAIPALMERIVAGVTSAHDARYTFGYSRGFGAVINDAGAADWIRSSVVSALGAEAVADAIPTMGAEDFSVYLEHVPGCFFFVGARNEERGIVHPHHHDQFDIDERALDYGTRVFVAAALDRLARDR
jgi:amidohydrolase